MILLQERSFLVEKTEKNYAKRGKNIKIVLKLCVRY